MRQLRQSVCKLWTFKQWIHFLDPSVDMCKIGNTKMPCAEVLIITISLVILCLNCDMRISVENVFLSSWEQMCVEFGKVKKGNVQFFDRLDEATIKLEKTESSSLDSKYINL